MLGAGQLVELAQELMRCECRFWACGPARTSHL